MIDIKIDSPDDITRALKQVKEMFPDMDISGPEKMLTKKTLRGAIQVEETIDGAVQILRVEFPPIPAK